MASDYPNTYYTHTGLTTNEGWYYRYLVRNTVGWSGYSPVTHTMVGTEPAQMVAPTVEIDADPTFVKISWVELSAATNGGLSIDRYIV